MISAISDWVKNLIFLMLFAAFLELLLPTNEMKKFLRMIIGIFLMLAILRPISSFLASDFTLRDIPVLSNKSNKQISSLKTEDFKQKNLTYVVYCKELSEQIKKVLENIPEISDINVEVKLAADKKFTDNEFIEKIMIKAKMKNEQNKIIVNLGENNNKTVLNEEVKNKIIQRINSLYQISPNKITFE